jgi:hypothetical protein
MDKCHSISVNEGSVVMFQTTDDDSGIPEPAIIDQYDRSINVNYESIPEIIKQMKLVYDVWKAGKKRKK